MLHFHINGVSVAAPTEARALDAYRAVTGDTSTVILVTPALAPVPEVQPAHPMGFAISPRTGCMTAIS